MSKIWIIARREYFERVRNKMFIIMTLIGPALLVLSALLPALLFRLDAGGAKRIRIFDETGRLYERVRDALESDRKGDGREARARESIGRYEVSSANSRERSLEDVRRELVESVRRGEIDFYVILPRDVIAGARAEVYGRNPSDLFTVDDIEAAINDAVIEARMREAQIDPSRIASLSERVRLNVVRVSEQGEEKISGAGFFVAFIVGFLIYMTIILHGQAVLSSVVEEKNSRVIEVLLSSARAFDLMMGKLVGISLVALTQYAVWGVAAVLFWIYGLAALAASGINLALPSISPLVLLYFLCFFLVGFFIYATLYALAGATTTTTQEGGQLAMPVIFLLVIGFYLVFPVMRSPNSTFATVISLVPFFTPVIMPVRLVTEAPPVWETLLSLALSVVTAIGLVWIAARVYRVGILMYGKRATIPEIWRWIRQP